MKEDEFLKKLSKLIPELVYSDSLLDSESIEIPIYFRGGKEVMLDFDSMREEFNEKLNKISDLLEGGKEE